MGSRYHPSVYRARPEELATHKALARRAIDKARALLRREPHPDTFLGVQHYDFVPLPEEISMEMPGAKTQATGRSGVSALGFCRTAPTL